jgi:hypothetical protein
MRSVVISLATAAVFLFATQDPVWAAHETTTTTTQGNSGKPAQNTNNQGTTTTTTTGPKGQLDKGNTGCNNCDTAVTDRPGASK